MPRNSFRPSLAEPTKAQTQLALNANGGNVPQISTERDANQTRHPGGLEGLVIPDDFDAPDPEIEKLFGLAVGS